MYVIYVMKGMVYVVILHYFGVFLVTRNFHCLLFVILKPIFHCNANYLVSGVGVGQCPQRQYFALGIPTCWYLGANANP